MSHMLPGQKGSLGAVGRAWAATAHAQEAPGAAPRVRRPPRRSQVAPHSVVLSGFPPQLGLEGLFYFLNSALSTSSFWIHQSNFTDCGQYFPFQKCANDMSNHQADTHSNANLSDVHCQKPNYQLKESPNQSSEPLIVRDIKCDRMGYGRMLNSGTHPMSLLICMRRSVN